MPKLPNSRNIFGVLLILGNSVQYFLDGCPWDGDLPSLALQADPGDYFCVAAHLPPLGKKECAAEAALVMLSVYFTDRLLCP